MTLRPQMQNDAVGVAMHSTINHKLPLQCEMFESSHPIICSDTNKVGSQCRRFDCNSNHAICKCSNGECNWSVFDLVCFNDAEIATGCDINGHNCNGCDLSDWMLDFNGLISDIQCTNYNYEHSTCYRDDCLNASSNSKCICTDTKCYWDTIPECLWIILLWHIWNKLNKRSIFSNL